MSPNQNKSQHKNYEIIGFDLDGVLLDSVRNGHNEWMHRVLKKTLDYFGIPSTKQNMEKIRMDNLMKNIRTVCRDWGIEPEVLWQVREKNLQTEKCKAIKTSEITLFPDVKIVGTLSQNYTLVICSNVTQELLNFLMEYFSLDKYFSYWIGRNGDIKDLMRMKPNPYFLNKMILQLHSMNILYIGDREQDRIAAHRAGIDFLLLSRNGNNGDLQNLYELVAYLQ